LGFCPAFLFLKWQADFTGNEVHKKWTNQHSMCMPTKGFAMKTTAVFDFDELARRWPSPLVCRDQEMLDRFSGGVLRASTLAKLDCLGQGPEGRVRIGRKVCYPKENLVRWMRDRAEILG
jgi:hypothetical protein